MKQFEPTWLEEPHKFEIKAFFDPDTYTLTYVVYDTETKDAVVIDPVLDYDPKASKTSTNSVKEIIKFIEANNLNLKMVLETHAHADHLSGAQVFVKRYGVPVGIGENITKVQKMFKEIFNLPDSFATDGSQFDRLFKDGEIFEAGSLRIKAIYTPGHTPACVTYLIGDALFTGDSLFMDDYGTGRCDFPGGSAEDMYDSIHGRLYKFPDETRVFVGHDYLPNRELAYETTIGKSKKVNPMIREETTKEEYVKMRNERDAKLAAPRLLFQSVQVNIDAGNLPQPESNGIRYLKVPVNVFRGANQKGIDDPFAVDLEEREI